MSNRSRRPASRSRAMDVAFAATLLPSLLGFAMTVIVRGPQALDVVAVIVYGIVVALWWRLKWEPAAPGTGLRRAAWPAVAFILVSFTIGFVAVGGLHIFVPLLGFANLAFVLGWRVSAAVLVGCTIVIALSEWLAFGNPFDTVVGTALTLVAGGTLSITLGASTAGARRDRDEAVALSARIRELTLAEERARMSREMHDSVGHHLTVAKMTLANAELLRATDADAAWAQVDGARSGVDRALTETRLWVRALRPAPLADSGLEGALRALADSPGGVDVRLTMTGDPGGVGSSSELVLYRAAQEGLTNAVRHAHANRIDIRLQIEEPTAVLEVRDDGSSREPIDAGFGLTALRERAELLGGRLEIGAGEPPGTVLRVTVPCSPATTTTTTTASGASA